MQTEASVNKPLVTSAVKTSVRWKNITTTLLMMWIIGMIDKIGVAVVATNKHFLVDMHLVGQNALIGSLVTSLLFSYGLGFFIWGKLTDRWGPRRCSIIGLTGWGISTIIAALAPNFQVLLISRILLGLSEAFLWPVSNSLTARWFPLSERGRAKSVWINGTNIGPGITGFLVTFLIAQFEWRGVFWFMSILAFLVALPMVIFLTADDPAQHKKVSPEELKFIKTEQLTKEHKKVEKNVRKTLSYWLAVLVFGVDVIGMFGLSTWFPSYLANAKHFSPQATSFYMLFAYVAALLLTIWVGSHTDKTHKKAIWTFLGFLGAAVLLILAIYIPSPVVDALLVGGSLMFVQGFDTPMSHGLMHSMSPTEEMGTNVGIMSGVANLLAAFIPTIMGALITFGHGSYMYAFVLLIGCFIVGAGSGFGLTRRGY